MTNDLLKIFPLQLLFRGIFPGCFFALSYNVVVYGWLNIGKIKYLEWLPLIVLVGVITYVLHRSLIYGLIEHSFEEGMLNEPPLSTPIISERTQQRLLAMWSTGEKDEPYQNIARHMAAWNDYIQLQYVSAECIFIGYFYGCHNSAWVFDFTLVALCSLLLLGGLVSEHRFRHTSKLALHKYPVSEWWQQKRQSQKKAGSN